MENPIRKIGIYVKQSPEAESKAGEFSRWLDGRGIAWVRRSTAPPVPDLRTADTPPPPGDLGLIVAMGGDGTFLSAARWVGEADVPILGVKFGEVGFLSETTQDRIYDVMEEVLAGRYATEERSRLAVTVTLAAETVTRQVVLNDAVINNGTLARLAHIRTFVNGEYLTTYRADGLIVATPTGSTAYSLAAGGPIIHPAVKGTLLTPICPFTLTNRPLIVPDQARIQISLEKRGSDITITFDGQAGLKITEDHVIEVAPAATPTRLVKVEGQNYFDVLKTKLRWSGGK